MGTYRVEWPCCDSVTETDSWGPTTCPFCTPVPDKDGERYRKLRAAASFGYPSGEGSSNRDAYLVITGYGDIRYNYMVDEAVDTLLPRVGL